jgi:hypothetical protein
VWLEVQALRLSRLRRRFFQKNTAAAVVERKIFRISKPSPLSENMCSRYAAVGKKMFSNFEPSPPKSECENRFFIYFHLFLNREIRNFFGYLYLTNINNVYP